LVFGLNLILSFLIIFILITPSQKFSTGQGYTELFSLISFAFYFILAY